MSGTDVLVNMLETINDVFWTLYIWTYSTYADALRQILLLPQDLTRGLGL